MKQLLLILVMLAAVAVRAQQPVPPAATQAQANAGIATFPYISPATLPGGFGLMVERQQIGSSLPSRL